MSLSCTTHLVGAKLRCQQAPLALLPELVLVHIRQRDAQRKSHDSFKETFVCLKIELACSRDTVAHEKADDMNCGGMQNVC